MRKNGILRGPIKDIIEKSVMLHILDIYEVRKSFTCHKEFSTTEYHMCKGGLYNQQRQGYGMFYDHSISSWAEWNICNRRFENLSVFSKVHGDL